MPTEHTVEVNGTSQQLTALSAVFEQCTATAPSRSEEGNSEDELGKGYDISLDVAKEVVFQYKRPKKARVRGPNGSEYQWLFFKMNMEQVYTLALLYAPGEAFIACPVVTENRLLTETLERTVYVDVYTILLQTLLRRQETRYIAAEYRPESKPSPHVVGKYAVAAYSMRDGIDTSPYYRLKRRGASGCPDVYLWDDLESKIESCSYGLPIRGIPHTSSSNQFGGLSLDPDDYPEPFEALPDGYETLGELFDEVRERFDRAYQSYLARRLTLRAFATTDDHQHQNRYAQMLLSSLLHRIRLGSELGRVAVPEDFTFPGEEEPHDPVDEPRSDEIRWIYENILEPRRKMANPLSQGVSRSGHHILQRSTE